MHPAAAQQMRHLLQLLLQSWPAEPEACLHKMNKTCQQQHVHVLVRLWWIQADGHNVQLLLLRA
jgi:hypothetical protein